MIFYIITHVYFFLKCFLCVFIIGTLRRIDLTGNLISEIEDGAFSRLDQLEELTLAGNRLTKLPMLPPQLISLNANHNRLKTKGIRSTILKVMNVS